MKYNNVLNTNLSKDEFDFSQTNVMFISPNYTTYQLKSVEFSDIAFELWKVVKYSNGTVLFDKVNNSDTTASIKQITGSGDDKQKVDTEIKKYTEEDTLMNKSDDIRLLYDNLKELILSNYDDIEIKHLKHYFVFKTNNQIVASAELFSKFIKAWINLKETEINDPDNRIKDVTNIGHHGVGKYEYKINSEEDLYYFNKLFKQSYDEKL